jgi:hypothetical protein
MYESEHALELAAYTATVEDLELDESPNRDYLCGLRDAGSIWCLGVDRAAPQIRYGETASGRLYDRKLTQYQGGRVRKIPLWRRLFRSNR